MFARRATVILQRHVVFGVWEIATVPSVNIEYSSEAAKRLKELKELKGYVSRWVVNGDRGGE